MAKEFVLDWRGGRGRGCLPLLFPPPLSASCRENGRARRKAVNWKSKSNETFKMASLILQVTWPLLLLFPVATSGNTSAVLEYFIREEVPPGSIVGNIVDDHLDRKLKTSAASSDFRFVFLTRPVGHLSNRTVFTIDESRGIIRTVDRLDREVICRRHEECVVRCDVAIQPMQYFEMIRLRVKILDINDNAPNFTRSRVTFELSEGAEPGSSLKVPSADDRDFGRNALCRYALVPRSDHFELIVRWRADGSADLRLVLTGSLDRETVSGYRFTVVATDSGDPQMTGSMEVDVVVTDVNDNCPQFRSPGYEAEVREDVAMGTVLVTVTATDPDAGSNGRIRYAFAPKTVNEHGRVFRIDSASGEIYTTSGLDHEVTSAYKLYVVASDGASGGDGENSLSAHAPVEVRVQDVNDNAPRISFSPLTSRVPPPPPTDVTDDVTEEYVLHVIRTSPEGTFVAHAIVSDRDSGANGRVDCQLVGGSKAFQVQRMFANQFKIVTSSNPDLRNAEIRDSSSLSSSYDGLRLVCRDEGVPSLSSSVPLRVVEVEENLSSPLFFQSFYRATVFENLPPNQTIVKVDASDDDPGEAGQLTFSLLQETHDHDQGVRMVEVDPRSGVIRSLVTFDREVVQQFDVVVVAEDGGFPTRSTSVRISIVVLDVDDVLPAFDRSEFHFRVSEDSHVGSVVGTVTASDADEPPFDAILYSLDDVTYETFGTFGIEVTSGRLTIQSPLDRETTDSYHLLVKAFPANRDAYDDDEGDDRKTSCDVIIIVDDVNDNAPGFDFPAPGNDTLTIVRRRGDVVAAAGHVIGRLRARDPDSGDNGRVTYAIDQSCDPEVRRLVRVDPTSGAVTMATPDESFHDDAPEAAVSFRLPVVATDSGRPGLSTVAVVKLLYVDEEVEEEKEDEEEEEAGSELRWLPSSGHVTMDETLLVVTAFVFAALLVAVVVVAVVLHLAKRERRLRRKGAASSSSSHRHRPPPPRLADGVGQVEVVGVVGSFAGGGASGRVVPAEFSALERRPEETKEETPPGGTGSGKPVVVFIKDLSEEGGSAWGSDSNSDSGRGPSSEDGDPAAAGASGASSGPSAAARGGQGRAPPRSTDALHRSSVAMTTTTTTHDVKRTSRLVTSPYAYDEFVTCHDLTQCPLRRSNSSVVNDNGLPEVVRQRHLSTNVHFRSNLANAVNRNEVDQWETTTARTGSERAEPRPEVTKRKRCRSSSAPYDDDDDSSAGHNTSTLLIPGHTRPSSVVTCDDDANHVKDGKDPRVPWRATQRLDVGGPVKKQTRFLLAEYGLESDARDTAV